MHLPLLLAHGSVWRLFTQAPPLHPILVNLTAGLIPAGVGFDVLGRTLRRTSLASAGWWATVAAAVVTPFTALAGWLWLDDMGGHGQAIKVHEWLGTILAVLVVGLALWRWSERRREARADANPGPRPAYLIAAATLLLAVAAQGHIGGMMSFGSEEHHHEEATGGAAHMEASAHHHADDGAEHVD